MELVLSIIIIVQTYVGVRFYIKTQKDLDNINQQIADIHRHDVENIYEYINKVEGNITKYVLTLADNIRDERDTNIKELRNIIESKKLETEQGVKEYLNSWRTSSEFRRLLRTIEKQEDKNTSQNVY
tara:strand:+ start:108 stop:488 length:381 start_codon:yes stop_codon:yes gene_type:complete